MAVEITVRHGDNKDAIQRYANERAEGLMAEFPRLEFVHVILDEEKHSKVAEFVVQGKNHIRVGIKEEAEVMRVAIDEACGKVEAQLRRLRDKIQDHKPAMKQQERRKAKEL